MSEPWIKADWPHPPSIVALTTKRFINSQGKWVDFNLATHVTPHTDLVERNRALLGQLLSLENIQWLNQVHGSTVLALPHQGDLTADGCYTTEPYVVCAVLTADCLPVLITDVKGQVVCALHCGWKSLKANIIEEAMIKLRSKATDFMAYLGPAIGPKAFEVGPEVREAFLNLNPHTERAFIKNPNRPTHYFSDLYEIARILLKTAGVEHVYGGTFCTFTDKENFYSFRRQPETGRMATLIFKTT